MSKIIFYRESGMDCDCVSYVRYRKCKASEFASTVDEIYEWADGPCNVVEVTEDEYRNGKDETYDHVMAAYENGNGNRHII